MSEESQGSGAAQAGGAESSQEDTRQAQAGSSDTRNQTQSSAEGDDTQSSRQQTGRRSLSQELEEARRDAARYRNELREYQNRDMTDMQKLQRDHGELQTTHQQITGRVSELERENRILRGTLALSKQGAVHPELLAERLTDEDLVDDKSAKAAAESLRKEYPELFSRTTRVQGSADGANEGTSANRKTTMSDMIRQRAGVRTP